MHLWMLRMDRPLTEMEYTAMQALLPPKRRERLAREPVAKHGEVLCAYGLLLALLWMRNGWSKLPAIAVNNTGKPYFPGYPDVFFSISHTDGAAAAAVSARPVGVDIQCIREIPPRLGKRTEYAESPELFFRNWVRWEARAKRVGGGLADMVRQEPPLANGEHYTEAETFVGYAAGIASEEPVLQGAVRRLSTDDLLRLLRRAVLTFETETV